MTHVEEAIKRIRKATALLAEVPDVDPDTAIANNDDAQHELTEALKHLLAIKEIPLA